MPKGSKEGVCPYCGAAPCNQKRRSGLVDVGGLELRRTFRDFGGEEGTNGEGYDFSCSACGFMCDLPDALYCPHCGAKVIDE